MMSHDESLELGITAGLNVPTALVISKRPDHQSPQKAGCNRAALVGIIAGLVGLAVVYLLR